MIYPMFFTASRGFFAFVLMAFLSACGGGGGGDTTDPALDDSTDSEDIVASSFKLTQIDTAGRKPYEVEMAFNSSGQAVAIWPGVEDGSASLGPPLDGSGECWASPYEPLAGWGAPIKLTATSFCNTGSTRVGASLDENNDAAAVWRALYGNIQAASVINGVSGGVSEFLYDRANFPAISAGRPGGIVAAIAWEGEIADNQSEHQVLNAAYTLGSGWSEMEALPDSANTDVDPVIAVLDDGRRIAVWIERLSSGPSIVKASLWSPGSVWSTPVVVSTATGESGSFKVTLSPGINGRALLVWDEHNPGTDNPKIYSVKASWFNGVVWDTPWVLDPDVLVDFVSIHLLNTRVGTDSLGNALVAWVDIQPLSDPLSPSVKTAKYRDGQWEPAEQIAQNQSFFELAVNAKGDAAIVWVTTEFSTEGRGSRLSSNSQWTDKVTIKSLSLSTSASYQPHVALSPDGEAIIVWSQFDTNLQDVNPIEHTLWSAIGRFE